MTTEEKIPDENSARFNSDGNLEVWRNHKFKMQVCPFSVHTTSCGDSCPLLREHSPAGQSKLSKLPPTVSLECGGVPVHYFLVRDPR